MKDLLTVSEVSQRLQLSPQQIYRMLERREIPHTRIRRSLRVSEEQLARFITSQEVPVRV